MGVPLTAEQIREIMKPAPRGRKPKEKPQTIRFPAPPQHGPLRYMEHSSLCVVSGYYKYDEEGNKEWVKTHRGCRTQTHYRLQGIPMCATHALRTMNEMLFDSGVDLTQFILDEKTVQQIEHDAVEARLIRGNENLLNRLKSVHELLKNGNANEAVDELDTFLVGVSE